MKNIYKIILVLIISFVFGLNFANAYVNVKGYYRSDGTYVSPHVRSNPNGLKYDNYSWTPSQGLYNSTYGTRGAYWDTPTYITDPYYYQGKSLYNQYNNSYKGLYYPAVSTKPTKNVSYVTKTWADNNPYTSCEQSIFLRSKEKLECESYKKLKNSYTWVTTTGELDGMHYRYDSTEKMMYSCPDGQAILYSTLDGKPTNNCYFESNTNKNLLSGCVSFSGYSVLTGLSCATGTCSPGMSWNGSMCE